MAALLKEEKMELTPEEFGPFWQFLQVDTVTDIDFQGQDLWITDLKAGVYKVTDAEILKGFTKEFIDLFTRMVADHVNRAFNKSAGNNVLEAETDSLRIEIMHESVAMSGRSVCIRKSPPIVRNTIESAITSKYILPDALSFLINCVTSRFSMAFCGEPGVGKTEMLKFLAQNIAKNQKVITIEDNPEIHYGDINPGALYQELKIDGERFSYTTSIKSCLRLNPKWIILSEARSREVKYLLEAWSTGVSGMTTLHTDDVRKIPERIKNMMADEMDSDRMDNSIYESLKVGVLLRQKYDAIRKENYRYVDQIGIFYRENDENRMQFIVKDGEMVSKKIPGSIQRVMKRNDIFEPFKNELVTNALHDIEADEREEAEADRRIEEAAYLDDNDPEISDYMDMEDDMSDFSQDTKNLTQKNEDDRFGYIGPESNGMNLDQMEENNSEFVKKSTDIVENADDSVEFIDSVNINSNFSNTGNEPGIVDEKKSTIENIREPEKKKKNRFRRR